MRTASLSRKTAETDITLTLNIDGTGKADVKSGNGFFDHMLTLLARHARFDITLCCNGDTDVDFHHSAEDIGIVLGQAFEKALGDKCGITRFADTILPMDEALVMTAIDISGRRTLVFDVNLPRAKVGGFDTELVLEFMTAFVMNAAVTLHIKSLSGTNTHHIIECAFKSLGRTLRYAVKLDPDAPDSVPSTKGVL